VAVQFVIDLKDNVSAPAKGMSASVSSFASAMTKTSNTVMTAVAGIGSAISSLGKGDVTGAIETVTHTVAGLAKMLDLVVPGLGQVVSAVVEVAGGIAGLSVGLLKSAVEFTIASSQAKGGMLAMFDALGEGNITGEQTDAMLDGLRAKLGVTKDAMVPLVKEFMAMGVTSQAALEKMTTAALSAKALTGGSDAAAQAFTKLSKKIQLASEMGHGLKIPERGLGSLASMGLTVADVAAKMGTDTKKLGAELKAGTADASKFGNALQDALIAKGAGPLDAMSLSAANLGAIVKEYVADLFEDMRPEVTALMKEVKGLFGVLDAGKPSGEAIKTGLMAYLKQVFGVLTKLVPIAKHFFLDVIIYALKAYLSIKPLISAFKAWAASAEGASTITAVLSTLWTVLKVIGVIVLVVVAAFVGLWLVSVGIAAAIWILIAVLLSFAFDTSQAVTGAVLEMGAAIVEFVSGAIAALVGWASSAATAASDFISGLVTGIQNGASQIIAAVTGLAAGAKGAFKKALGISSPSKVMMEMGTSTGEGFAEGMTATAPDVHAAVGDLSAAASAGVDTPAAGGAGKGAKAGGAVTVNVAAGAINIDGAGKTAMEITEEMLSLVFERVALTQGL
jgi:hypothetical protein